MKAISRLLLLCVFIIPISLAAQSPVGKWKMTVPGQDGNPMTITVDIKGDGTYAVDFGGDGSVEVNGKYELSGDQMTIMDTDGPNACPGAKGVYKFAVNDSGMTMTVVNDPCEGRGGPEGVMTWQRG